MKNIARVGGNKKETFSRSFAGPAIEGLRDRLIHIYIVPYPQIERVARDRGHRIAGKIDIDNLGDLDTASADAAIEFSHPDAAYDNVRKCIERNIPVVCGTTGWLARQAEIDSLAKQ
jgi:hypothetical protein